MLTVLTGAGMVAGAVAVVYPFIPAPGTEPTRSEWFDIHGGHLPAL